MANTTTKKTKKSPALRVHAGTMFKVLVDGEPCHGGSGAYPPIGKWTHPVEPNVCESGYHLTTDPLRWWKPKSRLYIAECRGKVSGNSDDKAAFESVRLLEEVTREWPLICANPRVRLFLAAVDRSNNAKADISWANLSMANLSEANLYWANLSGANLSMANLSEANLYWANLSRANLSGANLSRANLSGANLSEANLYWANLSGANLSGANLYWANLSGAIRPESPPDGWIIRDGRLVLATKGE